MCYRKEGSTARGLTRMLSLSVYSGKDNKLWISVDGSKGSVKGNFEKKLIELIMYRVGSVVGF